MSLSPKEQILLFIEKTNQPLIVFREKFNEDDVAAAIALKLILEKLGKKNVMIASSKFSLPKNLHFLPSSDSIRDMLENVRKFIISVNISKTKVDTISYNVKKDKLNFIISPKDGWFDQHDITTSSSGFNNDAIIAINSPDLEGLGELNDDDTEFFYDTPILNIDHKADNEQFVQINIIDMTASSTCEIIGRFFYEFDKNIIDEDIATCLLTGMIANTKSWKTANVTPQALTLASNLVSLDGRREEIMNHLFRSRTIPTLRLWGRVLARLHHDDEHGITWSVVPKKDFENDHTDISELHGVIDELILNAQESKIVALIYQPSDDLICAYVTGGQTVNAKELVSEFKPEGTLQLAHFCMKETDLKKAEHTVLDVIRKNIKATSAT